MSDGHIKLIPKELKREKAFDVICDFCKFTATLWFPFEWSFMRVKIGAKYVLRDHGWIVKKGVHCCPNCVSTAKEGRPN